MTALRTALPLLAVVAAGCQDPTVTVSVVVPDGSPVATLTVSALVFDDDKGCVDLELGRVDPETMESVTQSQVTVAPGQSIPIAGVPREDRKLWFVEGREREGTWIVAGCAEQGAIEGDAQLEIVTEPVVDLLVPHSPADQPLPPQIAVTAEDHRLAAVPDRPVRVQVFGPGQDAAPAPDERDTGADGVATFDLVNPDRFGPVAAHVRARWARRQPLVVRGFRNAELMRRSISDGPNCANVEVPLEQWQALRVGAFRGAAGLATGATGPRIVIAAWNGQDEDAPSYRCSDDVNGVTTFGVMRGEQRPAPQSDILPKVVAASATDLYIFRLSNTDSDMDGDPDGIRFVNRNSNAWTNNPHGTAPVAIISMRECGVTTIENDYALVQFEVDGASRFHAYEVERNALVELTDAPLPALLDAEIPAGVRMTRTGCIVRDGTDELVRALILEQASDVGPLDEPLRFLAVETGDTAFVARIDSSGPIGFTRADVQAESDPLLIGAIADPAGARVVRWRVWIDDDGLELREVGADPALSPPTRVGYDHLDGDDALDAIWTIHVGESRLQISLGKGADGLPLVGVSGPLTEAPGVPFLDPQGNNTGDLLLATTDELVFLDTSELVE